jgi:hypothetical protein
VRVGVHFAKEFSSGSTIFHIAALVFYLILVRSDRSSVRKQK